MQPQLGPRVEPIKEARKYRPSHAPTDEEYHDNDTECLRSNFLNYIHNNSPAFISMMYNIPIKILNGEERLKNFLPPLVSMRMRERPRRPLPPLSCDFASLWCSLASHSWHYTPGAWSALFRKLPT